LVPIIENVIEQNLIGFPNSMCFHVETYRPYFGYGYSGLGIVLAVLPPMSSHFTNITIAPNPILGVAQAKVVTDNGEPSDDDDIF
jgi:hypothetical protein